MIWLVKMVLAPPESLTVEVTICRFGKKVLHLRHDFVVKQMFRISYGYNQNQGDDDLVDNISTAPANSMVVQLKTKRYGKTQKNPKMQTLKSLNHMMKLYHVTVNNRIYLTRYDCCKSQSIVSE